MQRPVSSSQGNRRTFDKYESGGAYHWKECDRRSRTFNPPLVARYQVVADRITDDRHPLRFRVRAPRLLSGLPPLGSVRQGVADRITGAAHVLEIGAGDGRLTALLAESGARVVGIEIDDTAVRLASSALWRMENCAIAQADCYKLPFPTEIFDVAVMADVIEHLDEPESALEEAARVLKPGGVLILTTPKWRPDRVWDVHHVREFTPSEIGSCLKKFFERVDISYFWPLFWSNVYSSRIGWRALRVYARYFPNPFLKVGSREESFGQILAMCCNPTKNLIRKAEKPGSCTIYD